MKKLVILLAAALTFNSCSDSFLDLSNPSALSPSVYPKSMADMETIVTSVYANMVAVPLYGKRVMAKGTFCVDHTVDMAWTGCDKKKKNEKKKKKKKIYSSCCRL